MNYKSFSPISLLSPGLRMAGRLCFFLTLVLAIWGTGKLCQSTKAVNPKKDYGNNQQTTVSALKKSRLLRTTAKPSVVRIPTFPQAIQIGSFVSNSPSPGIRLCQSLGPASPHIIRGVDCLGCGDCGEAGWNASRQIPWQVFAQGEYIGPPRTRHVPEYRLRVDDLLEFIYRLTREKSSKAYQLNVGDTIQLESIANPELAKELIIQPDGTISLHLLNQIQAAGFTVDELRKNLEERYKPFYHVPAITVTPTGVNAKLEDLRATVDSRAGQGGQSRRSRVTPGGVINLPAIGSVPAQGLTLNELKREIDERYTHVGIPGIEVTPDLIARAPRFVYVLGEVIAPGRYELTQPTTVMSAIALAGSWRNGGNLRQVVVFRRAEDWRLIATKLDLRGALLGKHPCPADEIWLRDSDIVLIPKSPILLADDFIELVFTRGIYGVLPFQGISINFSKLSSI